jgi:hypothetical protein
LRKDGTFVNGEVVSTKQLGRGGPILDPEQGAYGQIKSLTTTDFPELKYLFDDKGTFTYPKQ